MSFTVLSSDSLRNTAFHRTGSSPSFDSLLGSVSKPFRYTGGEVGIQSKEWVDSKVKFCLIYPDLYEIGSSHLGLSILYQIINDKAGMLAHRCFAPARDMESELRKNGIKLFSLEGRRPLSDFDIIGITLPYELTYTNILAVLELSGIPRRASERGDDHPMVIAGGSSAFNPEPVAPFFDAIVLGDGEEVVLEIGRIVGEHKGKRSKILEELSKLRGVYVPARFSPSILLSFSDLIRESSIKMDPRVKHEDDRKVPTSQRLRLTGKQGNDEFLDNPSSLVVFRTLPHDLNSAVLSAPLIPHRATHERAVVEVARGCKNGCRFCQAGFTYRPWRERDRSKIVELAREQLSKSGYDELSFLSLSLGDLSSLEEAVVEVSKLEEGTPFNFSFPSLRVESLTDELLKNMGADRAGSFTLAPEAATERMRRIINKGNTDEELYSSVERIFKFGWHQIKLYFMLGLPFETDAELDGIVEVANRCLKIGRSCNNRPMITVSTSTFVPKPHTPFQWASQMSIEETVERQNFLKDRLRRPGLKYKWHNAKMSFLEGVFSRGGRELTPVIERAFELGCRFDGWDEELNFENWLKAFDDAGIDPNSYLKERDEASSLPWDHLFAELGREYLLGEWNRAKKEISTPRCEVGMCKRCGVCER